MGARVPIRQVGPDGAREAAPEERRREMTGIERLRRVAEAQDMRNVWTAMLSNELSDIADQIERERACDADTIENIRLIVGVVIDDMERHILGHESMEDSPVERWARELREALGGDGRDPAADVSMSAYDLLPADERDAIAWVREHGGIVYVRKEWHSRVPYDLYERRRQRLLDHIAECETALRRRNQRIEELGKTIEFFQLNNSNFRHLLADVAERLGFTRYGDDYEPEDLLDALDRRLMPEGMEWPRYEDGEPVQFGDVVSDVEVRSVVFRDGGILLSDCTSVPGWGTWRSYKEPIRRPAKPEPRDSWERIEEDKDLNPFDYCKKVGHKLWTFDNAEEFKACDLVRRCRALAERERGE